MAGAPPRELAQQGGVCHRTPADHESLQVGDLAAQRLHFLYGSQVAVVTDGVAALTKGLMEHVPVDGAPVFSFCTRG